MPEVGGREIFAGQVIHSTQFDGGDAFKGRDVIVIGSGTSAGDICQDLVLRGASSVTMVQRASTTVVSIDYNIQMLKHRWPEDVPVEVSDFRSAAMPLGQLKEILKGAQPQVREFDKEMLKGLHEKGFVTNDGPDGAGQLWAVFSTLGGMIRVCASIEQ
jgi:cation diffusion facilitator CzcD-associated flavoprotein CzcO